MPWWMRKMKARNWWYRGQKLALMLWTSHPNKLAMYSMYDTKTDDTIDIQEEVRT